MTKQEEYAAYWESSFTTGLRKERISQGMSQTEMAEQMSDLGFKFHQATVHKIENGDRKVTAAEAWGLAEVLDVPLEHLYDWQAAHSTPEARRKLVRTQADRFLQLLLRLDSVAIELRAVHEVFSETVAHDAANGITEHKTINDPEVPIDEFYRPLLAIDVHEVVLDLMRTKVWVTEAQELASQISGVWELGPKDLDEDHNA